MNKKYTLFIVVVLFLFAFVGWVRAEGLTLTKVGVLSVVGLTYSNIDYTGGIPMLEGTATAGASVTLKIKNAVSATLAASPSGIWRFVPASLDTGINSVLITSGSQSISFTLSFNATTAATTLTPTPVVIPNELPNAGVWDHYLLMFGGGVAIMFLGRYVRRKMLAWEGKRNI